MFLQNVGNTAELIKLEFEPKLRTAWMYLSDKLYNEEQRRQVLLVEEITSHKLSLWIMNNYAENCTA